jgi:DNA repair exonuclease SbcCD nuclease subunit
MAKILFIGDPHIRHTHLSDGISLLRWIENVAEEKKPDLIVNLGDTFDSHAVIRSEVLSEVVKHLSRLSSLNIPVIMLLGNHDFYKPNSKQYHALEVLKFIPGVTIVDSFSILDGIAYIPYLENGETWPECDTKIAVTHNTFIGADYGFKIADDGIDLSCVSNEVIFSGHIHKAQILSPKDKNGSSIVYPGAPMAFSASDADQDKSLSIFDTETNDIEIIPSPFPCWKILEFNVGDGDLTLDPSHRWTVKLIGQRSEVKAFLSSDMIRDVRNTVHVTFRTAYTDSVKENKVSISAPTISKMTEQYVDKVYSGSLDKKTLKTTLSKYMESI